MNINEPIKIIQPTYYRKFQCQPHKCLESCCERWKIIIDKKTYAKYLQSNNITIKELVKTGLSINQTSKSDEDFGVINLNNEMKCPFLNQKDICEIVINMGDDSLSKTCKTYPRAITKTNDGIERALEMSCSVAAELALLDENGIKFESIIDNIKPDDVYVVTPSIEDQKQRDVIEEIRRSIIEILQIPKIQLSEKVALIGYFLKQTLSNIDALDLNYIETLSKVKEVKEQIKQGAFNTSDKPNPKVTQQFNHLNTILSIKFKEGDSNSFFSKRYIECLMQVLDAFSKFKEKDLEKQYIINYKKYIRPFLRKKAYILENFLVNYVFIYSNEILKVEDFWTWYMKLCVIFGMVKLNLVGLAIYNKGMNDDLMLKLIQSLTKTIISDKKYFEAVIKYLQNEQLIEHNKLITLILD